MFSYLNGKLGFDFGIHDRYGLHIGLNMIWGLFTDGGGHGIALSAGFRF